MVDAVEKAYKYRIYPNKKQKEIIVKTFGCCRFVYNTYLAKRIKMYEENKETFTYIQCSKDLTELKKELEWLKEIDSTALQSSLKDLDIAYQKFFKEHTGFPKFKLKKTHRFSYKTKCINGNIQYCDKYIKLPKLGLVKTKNKLIPQGRICNATIERNPTEYKYNSLVNNIIYTNKFVELNEVDNKYYFNDVAYKVTFFERKYREYVQQLIVLYNAMRCYGYKCNDINVSYINEGYEQDDSFASALAEAKIVKTAKIADQTAIANELLDIITEDRIRIYKDAMEGRYEIKKGNVWNEDIHSMIMTVKDIEVFEKVVPTFISMSKNYSIKSIKGMFNYCVDKKGNYKWADLKRLKKLITIQYNAKRDRIDLPMVAYMNNIDKFIDDANERTTNDINMFIAENAEKFAKEHSIGKIDITKSRLTMENIINHFTSLFDILIEKKKMKKKNSAYKLLKRQLLWKERDEEMIEDINEHRYAIEQFFPEFIEAINDLNSTNKIVSLNAKTQDTNIVEQDSTVDCTV